MEPLPSAAELQRQLTRVGDEMRKMSEDAAGQPIKCGLVVPRGISVYSVGGITTFEIWEGENVEPTGESIIYLMYQR